MFNIEEKILKYLKGKKVKSEPIVKLTSEEEVEEKKPSEEVTETESSVNSELHKSLKESNKKLQGVIDKESDRVVLDKIEYTPKTEEEIKKTASEAVEEEFSLKKNALDKDLKDKTQAVEKKASEVEKGVSAQKDSIENAYNNLESQVENQAVKRGIARSSIIAEQLKGLGVEKIKDLLAVDDKVATTLKGYNDELQALKSDYEYAVENLNTEKAIAVRERIEKLLKEQNEKIEEVLKYNNTVDKNQLYIDDKYYGGVDSGEESSQISESEKAKIRQKMITDTISHFGAMPKAERLKAFESDEELQELLGDLYKTVERYIKYLP
ncbi:MAG: hypothetical protein IKL82_05715 [Clostridia bacterium]|nr:hypothetical protein [Clostridia bacterium]